MLAGRTPRTLTVRFYRRADVCDIARRLLGKYLVATLPHASGVARTAGMIVETEAYAGPHDRASHAAGGRRTARTETMYASGGIAYVYLCYGIHALFNVVTHGAGSPHAVLVRALAPAEGRAVMRARRGPRCPDARLCAGPGALTAALGITTRLNGTPLDRPPVWIEDRGVRVAPETIGAAPRIGVEYAGEHAAWPWRFYIRGHPCVTHPPRDASPAGCSAPASRPVGAPIA